jgi:hypothetical protein
LLKAKHVENEADEHQRKQHGRNVENSPQPLPPLALGIEEYLFIGHDRSH